MRVNPGGKIPSSEAIGRDRLIENLWRILDRQSLVLSAERRMGKTCIVKKMTEEAPEGKFIGNWKGSDRPWNSPRSYSMPGSLVSLVARFYLATIIWRREPPISASMPIQVW
ncbi:MAG: hypothetical protein GDA43_05915 [Hormoscilla sp. SP5CHS1]|nr:hypothetical protein [Hormoscilla sp. SP12CHS1]MBC6452789.1 hypothetical protein [Hormoscilla sp. SP5CHS1]